LEAGVEKISVNLIDADPNQPRQAFDQDGIDQLACSIEEEGLLQPVSLLVNGHGRYVLIAGERRLRAVKQIGWEVVPAIIHDVDKRKARKLQMIENVVRKELNPIEYANGLKLMLDEGMSHREIDDALGQTRGEAKWHIQILGCCYKAQNLIATGNLGKWVGWNLARLSENGQMKALRIFQMRNFTAAQMVLICNTIYGEENQIEMFSEVELTNPEQTLMKQFMEAFTRLYGLCIKVQKLEKKKPSIVVKGIGDNQLVVVRMQLKEMGRLIGQLDTILAKAEAVNEVKVDVR